MNSFNKTEAAVFSCRLCFLRAFPFISLILPEDYCADVNLTRQSLDNGRLNSYGTQLLDICKQSGLGILNGRVGDDQNIGKYTYVASTGSSVVDYVISTPNMFNYIKLKKGKPSGNKA